MKKKKRFNKKILIILGILLALLIFYFSFKNIKFEKNFDFYGCPEIITSYPFNPGFHCGDLEAFVNYNEHVKNIKCLCGKYGGLELENILKEYVDKYVPKKNELFWDSLYSNNPDELCSLTEVGCI